MKKFEDYINEQSKKNENGLKVISATEAIGIWYEYMRVLREIYYQSHGDMESAGRSVKSQLEDWGIF